MPFSTRRGPRCSGPRAPNPPSGGEAPAFPVRAKSPSNLVCPQTACGKEQGVPRAIWSGAISFGLVSVPVRMFTATESKELKVHFLDRRDMAPIGYDKVNRE